MNDVGIIISNPGASVFDAKTNEIALNTGNPFIKIDTQNDKGFQTILLLITTNPPEPSGPSYNDTYTTVHFFPHGYKYVPSLETLFYVETPPPGTLFYQKYFQDSGQIAAQTAFDGVRLYAIPDTTNVYFIVQKFNGGGGGSPNLLTGTTIRISCHVFVEDIGQ